MKLSLFLAALLFSIVSCGQQNDTATINVKEDYADDWAALHHYAAENKQLSPPAAGEKRVIFLGSSIFEFWKTTVPDFFKNRPYLDRGIGGQISPQLLIRFRQDVIDLQPAAVIILAGSNDIAGSTGHITNEVIMNNIRSMTELAQLYHIKVILCEYLPVKEYPWRKGLHPAEKIISLNKAIAAYAKENKLTLLDYFTPLVDGENGQRAEWTKDGVHPNAAGYQIMAKVTEEAIAKALRD